MDDIEDLGASVGDLDQPENRGREGVTVRHRRRHAATTANGFSSEVCEQQGQGGTEDASLPGLGLVFLKTWGCSHNVSDGEYMAGQLQAYG